MGTVYRALAMVLLLAALGAIIAAVWLPWLWLRLAVTALFLIFAGAAASSAADTVRGRR